MSGFNLKRLPKLIRDKTVVAYKDARFPAAYAYALEAMQDAVDDLDLEKLKKLNVCADTLASMAKAANDDQGLFKVRQIKLASTKAADVIARALFERDKALLVEKYRTRWDQNALKNNMPKSGRKLTHRLALTEAGFKTNATQTITNIGRLTDAEFSDALKKGAAVTSLAYARTSARRSKAWRILFVQGGALTYHRWFRNNSAKSLSKKLYPEEYKKASERIVLMRAWCSEFLNNPP
jgi:hypothetical protein